MYFLTHLRILFKLRSAPSNETEKFCTLVDPNSQSKQSFPEQRILCALSSTEQELHLLLQYISVLLLGSYLLSLIRAYQKVHPSTAQMCTFAARLESFQNTGFCVSGPNQQYGLITDLTNCQSTRLHPQFSSNFFVCKNIVPLKVP